MPPVLRHTRATWILILTIATMVSSACSRSAKINTKQNVSAPRPDPAIVASQEFLHSHFIQEWIQMMESPFLNFSPDQLASLCKHAPVKIEIAQPLSCQDSIDLEKLHDSFDATCEIGGALQLRLKSNAKCTLATIALLRQKKYSGPLTLQGNRLEPNIAGYPLLSQVPPIVFSAATDSDPPVQIRMPSADAWIRTMAASGAVRVALRSTKVPAKSLESLAKALADFESPRKFAPQIKFGGVASPTMVADKLSQTQITWAETEYPDPQTERICEIISGWIDYQMLQVTKESTSITHELKCVLELDTPINFGPSKNDIEIGRLSFPMILSKTNTYPFFTLSDALSPSALLGLRLDL